MKIDFFNLLEELEEKLNSISLDQTDLLKRAEQSLCLCASYVENLKAQVLAEGFKSKSAEIEFFKRVKPQYVSRLIYHAEVYRIEMHKPAGSNKVLRKYFFKELEKLNEFYECNREFYQYYRLGLTMLDKVFFTRGKQINPLLWDYSLFDTDNRFSTSHDGKVSRILANDRLDIYLKAKLDEIEKGAEQPMMSPMLPKNKLKWTGSKTALIELIYALHSAGVFNQATSDIKDIAGYFEQVFDVSLGNYYRTYQEILLRKSGFTNFLDQLKDKLLQRIREADN